MEATDAAVSAGSGRSAVAGGAGAARAPRRVQVLPEALAMKIAAGEVIERPASVVKELVENALDAGAGRVTVELEDGGMRLIRVADDGVGMTPDDAPLAFTRHATSKIRDEADLERIGTLGFRGEALPSIAAVATVELTTRARDAATTATRVRVEGGTIVDVREAGAPEGTTVAVRDLFGSVPARRKFLKTVATELGQVVQLIVRLSLAYPGVHFRLVHHGREIAVYPPVRTLGDRVGTVFGRDRVQGGKTFEEQRLGLTVRGFLFSPQLSFASARYLYTFVNGRTVRDRGLTHAIVEGYASLIPRGRWPGAVVVLEVPAADVDVNVHPAKHEVRFRLAHVVHDTVMNAVRSTLAAGARQTRPAVNGVAEALERYAARQADERSFAFDGVSGARHGGDARSGGAAMPRHAADHARHGEGARNVARQPDARSARDADHSNAAGDDASERALAGAGGATDVGGFAGLRFVGQVFRGYIICEGADRLVLIDQHAAHERVAFERLRAEYRSGAIERQPLLLPALVELDPGRAEAIVAAEDRLAALGFDVEPFGEHRFLVRALPALLGADDPQLLLEDLADGLEDVGSQHSVDEAVEEILGRVACHSVVRVGRTLAPAEVEALLAALDTLAYASNCPHGRPVSVEFTRGQVERMFGR